MADIRNITAVHIGVVVTRVVDRPGPEISLTWTTDYHHAHLLLNIQGMDGTIRPNTTIPTGTGHKGTVEEIDRM